MRRKTGIVWSFALAALLSISGAWALDLKCPARINTDQGLRGAEAGWEAVAKFSSETPNTLSGVQFFEGHPSQMASLAPDQSREQKGKSVNFWKFEAKTSSEQWFTCMYSQTRVILARRLPAGISQCEVTYSKGYVEVERATCR